VTVWSELIVRVQVPVPLHPPPDQPPKLEPDPGDAVKVTAVPDAKLCEQVPGQAIPPPETLPEPGPARLTVRVCAGGGFAVKVAVTDRPVFIVTVQVPVPLHPPPDQPPKLEPDAGDAVSVTAAPDGKLCEQTVGQAIPPPEMWPEPAPAKVTVSVCSVGGGGCFVAHRR
jgi:hypothetical protein